MDCLRQIYGGLGRNRTTDRMRSPGSQQQSLKGALSARVAAQRADLTGRNQPVAAFGVAESVRDLTCGQSVGQRVEAGPFHLPNLSSEADL